MKHASHILACTIFLSYLTSSTVGFATKTIRNSIGFRPISSPFGVTATKQDDSDSNITSKNRSTKNARPKITTILGLDEFLEYLAESDDRIVVVEFYAAWCKSCHAFGMKYKQLASTYADKVNDSGDVVEKGNVRFAQVEYGANVRLCKTFGIKKLPYIQVYKAPLGKISEFVCGPASFDEKVKHRLVEYLNMSDEEIKFNRDMEEGQALSTDILGEAKQLEMKANATNVN